MRARAQARALRVLRRIGMNPRGFTGRWEPDNTQPRIPQQTDRPEREKIISKDEVVNLVIELNTCTSTEEFIRRM
jgi:hypothetical protein